jgi:hypothetical protein
MNPESKPKALYQTPKLEVYAFVQVVGVSLPVRTSLVQQDGEQ